MEHEKEQGTESGERDEATRARSDGGQTRAQGAEADLRHKAHHHARPRLMWGIAAVAVVAAGIVVWVQWGEEIHEACFGDNGACEVDLGDTSAAAEFETPDGF